MRCFPSSWIAKISRVHSELVSNGVIPLIEAGVITGARKNFKPRKIILGFAIGTKRLFDFLDNNPIFEFHPTAYTNNPELIARNDNMVAINSALQIDLTGQVCSDSIGSQFYSGIGGQVDFLRGAARSKGGKSIIAISSTAKDGAISRIVPMLSPGAGVVTSRGLIRYVVTEYGVAYSARQDHPATGAGADRHCTSQVSGRTLSILRENRMAAASVSCGDGSNEVNHGRASAR